MSGQGRPTPSRAPLASSPAWRRAGTGFLALLVCLVGWTRADAAAPSLRLRIAWGGGAARLWSGTVRLSAGSFSQLKTLGVEADEPGSISIDKATIEVRARSPRAYDGADVLIVAELESSLIVQLSADSTAPGPPVTIPLRDLIDESHTSQLDTQGNRLLVARAPGDRLRVELDRDNLVFGPGEVLKLSVTPYLIDLPPATPLRIQAQLIGAGSGAKVWSRDLETRQPEAEEEPTSLPLEIKLPEAEGVYDLTLAAANNTFNLRQPLAWKKPIAERKVQLLVIGTAAAPAGDQQAMSRVLEIDPVNPKWRERLTQLQPIPALRKEPIGTGETARWEHPRLGPMIQLGPGGVAPNISWEAYPLGVTAVGQPHVLEIEYPSDVPQTMGVSIIEPNAAGAVTPIGLDSGLYVSDEEADAPSQLLKHRLTFWPRTKTPLVLITNRRQGTRAVYGKIRLLTAAHGAFATLNLNRLDTVASHLPRAFAAEPTAGKRLLAGYLDRPLFAENFSAPESLDVSSQRSLDDWTTFHQGGLRLVEYLNHVGYNGLILAVLADGSTIYPSAHLDPTPAYDTGVFFGSGQDPVRKDVLELLLRLFDREGLKLIPSLQFSAPLAALEKLRRQERPEVAGLEWIGADGQTLTSQQPPKQGLAPFYNTLNPRVQAAMLDVARELATRYGSHPSFDGVALQMSASGYAQLPPGNWGYDDDTIARFQKFTGSQIPGAGPTRFNARAKYLNGPGRAAWLNWRAAELARFHVRMREQIVAASGKDAKLYLAGGAMLDHPSIQQNLRPALPPRLKLDDLLLSLGIRASAYREDAGIVLLRPHAFTPPGSLLAQAVDVELNTAPEVDRLFAEAREVGSLFYHRPQRARVPSFDAKSPFGSANTYCWLVSEMSPSGAQNRRRFVHSLATLDTTRIFDGGWLLPLGQEESLRDVIGVYRQLPAAKFTTLGGETQPLVIRYHRFEQQTIVYLANDSPWPATVTLRVDAPAGCRMDKFGSGRGVGALTPGAAVSQWTVSLQPFDLAGARFASAAVKFDEPRVKIDEHVKVLLARRIQDLGARASLLKTAARSPLIENPGFEFPLFDGHIPGWTAVGAVEGGVALDAEQKHGGGNSLRIGSAGPTLSLRSGPLECPETGRLQVSVWLRSADAAKNPTLRLAIEGVREDQPYSRFAVVGGAGPGAVPLGKQWAPYIFQVDDLPSEGLTQLRVRFDLEGGGTVNVDDIELSDSAFTPSELLELTKIITLANFQLGSGQLADCMRLLDGYWPRFLLANVELTQTPSSVASRPRPAAIPVAKPPAEKPGMLERMKGYVPKALQF